MKRLRSALHFTYKILLAVTNVLPVTVRSWFDSRGTFVLLKVANTPDRVLSSYNVRTFPSCDPVDVSQGPQLFIDDFLIASSHGLTRITQSPTRYKDNPILGWEQHTTQPYVTVLRDPETGRFRMWYNHSVRKESAIAYAESADGKTWDTPKLGILADTNRLFFISAPFQNGYGVSVIDDGLDYQPADRRYKAAWWGQTKPWPDGDPGMRVAFSPDGLHWTPYDGNPVLPDFGEKWYLKDPRRPYGVGDIVDVFWDPYRNRYGALVKTPAVPADNLATAPKARAYIRRLVSATASEDFMHWERPWRVIVPEPRDQDLLEFYSAGGTIARGGLLISFVRMLHDDYSAEPGGEAAGSGYATLATSRDGQHWERHADVFFDRNPEPGTWDRAMTWVGSVIPVDDRYYIYYGGYARGHKSEAFKKRQLGLALLPLDRFVARATTGDGEGELVTVPLTNPAQGRNLYLNADASKGQIHVQLLDENGIALEGATYKDTSVVHEDGLRITIRGAAWPKDRETIRLALRLKNASIYAFEWGD